MHLTGVVSETAYQHETHWLIFLFEVKRPVEPAEITSMEFDEGELEWVEVDRVASLDIPQTDREVMWPLVRANRGSFFAVHIDCRPEPMQWTVHEGIAPEPMSR